MKTRLVSDANIMVLFQYWVCADPPSLQIEMYMYLYTFFKTCILTAWYCLKTWLEEIPCSSSPTPGLGPVLLLVLIAVSYVLRLYSSHFIGGKLVLDGG